MLLPCRPMTPPLDRPALQARLHRDGFAFVTAEHMRQLLPMPEMDDWPAFRASWNDLAPDTYLAAVGRHRSRRHATFAIEPDRSEERSVGTVGICLWGVQC